MYDRYQFENEEKKRIFNIAIELMEKTGYEKLSIRTICEKANISIGKFYNYFSSKQELLSFYYSKAQKTFKEEVENQLDHTDVRSQIVQFYTWYAKYTASFGLEFVMNYFSPQNDAMNIGTYNNYILNFTDEILERAVQNGMKIPDGKTIHQISMDICIIVKGIIFTWSAEHGSFSLHEYTQDLLSRCIVGLLPVEN